MSTKNCKKWNRNGDWEQEEHEGQEMRLQKEQGRRQEEHEGQERRLQEEVVEEEELQEEQTRRHEEEQEGGMKKN